jgi:hypothetical protein
MTIWVVGQYQLLDIFPAQDKSIFALEFSFVIALEWNPGKSSSLALFTAVFP